MRYTRSRRRTSAIRFWSENGPSLSGRASLARPGLRPGMAAALKTPGRCCGRSMSFRQTRVLISSAVRTPPSRRLRHQPRSHNKQMLLSSPSTPRGGTTTRQVRERRHQRDLGVAAETGAAAVSRAAPLADRRQSCYAGFVAKQAITTTFLVAPTDRSRHKDRGCQR